MNMKLKMTMRIDQPNKPTIGQFMQLVDRLYELNYNAAYDIVINNVGIAEGMPAIWLVEEDTNDLTVFTFGEDGKIFCNGDPRW